MWLRSYLSNTALSTLNSYMRSKVPWNTRKQQKKTARAVRKNKIIEWKGLGKQKQYRDLLDRLPLHFASFMRFVLLAIATSLLFWVATFDSALMFICSIGGYGYLVVALIAKIPVETKLARTSIVGLILTIIIIAELIFCWHLTTIWYYETASVFFSLALLFIGMWASAWENEASKDRRAKEEIYSSR